ncbi:hypothetical protein ACP70R_044631 [Stipagrostis hirtigluma subsp. patula]
MDGASWPARWPPPQTMPPLPAPSAPPLPSQMDGGATPRHVLRPFAAQQAAPAAAPEPPAAVSASSSQPGQPSRAGPSNELLSQAPGSYSAFGLAPELRALFDKASASNAAGVIDLTRACASPLGTGAPLPKYPRHGLAAASSDEQSSLAAVVMNKVSNGMSAFAGQGSATDGITQGGEFFVGEAGLFGVICMCHRLSMSVAKFCEHAGGPLEKAGEIVRVENGMSIEQWFKFCVGPEWASMKTSPEEYRSKSPTSRNSSIGKMQLLGGYGKVTGPTNKQVYSSGLYIEGGGCTNFEKLLNSVDQTNYKKSVDVHEPFTKSSALLQNSTTINLGIAKNHTVHALDPNPLSTPSGSLHLNASMGRYHNGNHLVHNYGILSGKSFDASFRNPGPSSSRVLNDDNRAYWPDFPHKIFQDSFSNASNTELKLGQSSYHQSMTSLFPSVRSTVIEFQKPQSHVQLKNRNPCPKQTTKVNKGITKQNEPTIGTGNKKQSLDVANGRKYSEGDELKDDASKNSFITLFLSHLERNSTPEPIDDILNGNEHYLPKALDVGCSSDHSKIASRQIDARTNDNYSKLDPSIIHMKERSEGISLSAASNGYNNQDLLHANSQEPLTHGNYSSHLLPSQPSDGISKICMRGCPAHCRSCSRISNESHQVSHAETGFRYFYDKTARGRCAFESVEDVHAHRSLSDFAKISCKNGKSCCASWESLYRFCENDESTLGKSICGCCCRIQEDVSKLSCGPGHLCRAHFYSGDGPVLASKPTLEGEFCACACSNFIQRSSLCSREHMLQSSCHAFPNDGLRYRSSMGHGTDSLTKNSLLDTLNKNERGPCCNERCCYSAVPKCSGCGFTKHCDVRTDQIGHTVPKGKYQLQVPARCCTLGENEKLSCQCLSNRFAGRNISQTSLHKDVPNKVTNQPSIAVTERLKDLSEASVADGSLSKAVTEEKGAYRDSVISKGRPKFGCSSGSSSAVVTKFQKSPEFKNASSCTAKHSKHKNICDEGSRIEKCSASSYVATNKGCEEAVNSFPRSQLEPLKMKRKFNQISDVSRMEEKEEAVNSFPRSQLGPSRVKHKCYQISDISRLEEKDDEELCFGLPKKTRTLRCSEKYSESRTLRCSEKYSESDDSTRTSSQSSKMWGSQPQNEGNSFSCGVLRTKRKRPTMHPNKPVKQLHDQNKIFRGDEQPDDKGVFLGGLNSSDTKNQEDRATPDRIKHHQKRSRLFVRKLPKYVSLNCIVNEPNSEAACSGSADIDSSLIATGITNDNRKCPKIVPLNLVLKKAKRCRAVKPLYKTESNHLPEEKSSDCSIDSSDCSADKYSVDNENCSPQAANDMQGFKRSRYSSNDSRSHLEAHCESPCGGTKNRRASVSLARIKKREEFGNRTACYYGTDKYSAVQAREGNRRYSGRLSSDASCCVCGISNLEPCNQLIECSKCYIKVHQGCYGVLKVPRGQWFCRPCRTDTRNTVCVLCGYGGGAMTRALKSKRILKSLLKGLTTMARSENNVDSLGNASSEHALGPQNPSDSAHGDDIISTENITSDSWTSINHASSLLGPGTMQWVHMVCGLWTPGTKCPNATTMSAFDISGVSPAKRNTTCSMCNRTGGSFIKCRDANCSVLFHPWCAHRRGLLQSEPEGEHNENVGFYGRCLDHAIDFSNHLNPKKECFRSNSWSCARTEGFKGRKGEGWPGANHKTFEAYSGEFSVSQEQINAWLRINGSKSCGRVQKEYIHYKQLKGWKHLVVYKSGIHGLGLYTSVFIPRGSMVVEYVGEIIGQRVADKREIEYQSGRRQQYKSACYFFKIDKEHIIDATRKGGIARFVNHSCQPNCVAKIISVRNEKKVVFFAERHINPGEEITYDYHFNREDECQKIPCFCRSRYCRRYLN